MIECSEEGHDCEAVEAPRSDQAGQTFVRGLFLLLAVRVANVDVLRLASERDVLSDQWLDVRLKRVEDGRLGKASDRICQVTEVLNLVRAALRLRLRLCLIDVGENFLDFLANNFVLISRAELQAVVIVDGDGTTLKNVSLTNTMKADPARLT